VRCATAPPYGPYAPRTPGGVRVSSPVRPGAHGAGFDHALPVAPARPAGGVRGRRAGVRGRTRLAYGAGVRGRRTATYGAAAYGHGVRGATRTAAGGARTIRPYVGGGRTSRGYARPRPRVSARRRTGCGPIRGHPARTARTGPPGRTVCPHPGPHGGDAYGARRTYRAVPPCGVRAYGCAALVGQAVAYGGRRTGVRGHGCPRTGVRAWCTGRGVRAVVRHAPHANRVRGDTPYGVRADQQVCPPRLAI